MKLRTAIAAAIALALSWGEALAQATILPPGETCFQATTGINGMVGVLGAITGGSSYVNGTYGGVALTGGSGSNATANITVSGGIVTQVAVLNPGIQYVVGDTLSATAGSLGGAGSGFSVPITSTSINSSLAGGTVGFYIPNTQSFKQTWTDSLQTILNQNPVPLDQNGCAVIYGAGIYRQILKDSLGNTVWDKPTASTSPVGIFWAGLAGGTGNAITITDSAFALQDGATIQFLAKAANTGPTTISVSGGGLIAVINDTTTGPAALSGGEIAAGNTPMISYDAQNVQFHLVNPAAASSSGGASSSLTPPQGYLNLAGLASGSAIQQGDVVATATIFYSPYVGNTLPIWNGTVFKSVTFSELTAILTSAGSAANAIQDSCVFSNNGTPTLVTGPAWTSPAVGAANRGSGAGTAQITKLQGIWVNANTIIGYNGLSSFTIPANQCTIVGSLLIDAAPGSVTAYRAAGLTRRWGIWNFYNRQTLQLLAADPAASWNAAPTSWRQSNGNAADFALAFSGLAEEIVTATFSQLVEAQSTSSATINGEIGIGINSTTAPSGVIAQAFLISSGTGVTITTPTARASLVPVLGANQFNPIEQAPSGAGFVTFFGTSQDMLLSVQWRG